MYFLKSVFAIDKYLAPMRRSIIPFAKARAQNHHEADLAVFKNVFWFRGYKLFSGSWSK